MAQGQKYSDEIKEKARTMLAINNNLLEVSRQLGIPKTTLSTWKQQWLTETGEDSLGKLRTKRKQEIVEETWDCVKLGLQITKKGMESLDATDMSAQEIGQIATATTKLHQMHELASGDATERVEGNISIKKFEDIPE